MSYNGYPHTGATYVPGQDDYYEPQQPQVVSPLPQRYDAMPPAVSTATNPTAKAKNLTDQDDSMRPEVPDQIQTSLNRLDLNTNPNEKPPYQSQQSFHAPSAASSTYSPSIYADYNDTPKTPRQAQTSQTLQNRFEHNFPGIPKLPFRSANIPESDEERGARLERDRLPILNSSNFEEQIGWAQDALNWVDGAAEQDRRLAAIGHGRSAVPAVEIQMRTDAHNVVEHMANQNHPRATFMKGMWLEFGKFGHPENKRDAFEHYTRSAKGGYARAEYRIGMQFEATGNPQEAVAHYATGEAAGDSASCYRMGMIAALGQLGQPQDFTRAISLIRYAAESADENAPQGAYVYGMLLANDLPQIHVPQQFLAVDIENARRNIERSAFLGFSKAQLKMGTAYEVASLHCELNPVMSLHYNALAARQGEPEAEMALSKWFLVGAQGVFGKDDHLAFQYAERATQANLPTAIFAMGYFNEVGAGTAVNIDQARSWYERAAGLGSSEGTDALRRLDKQGPLSMRDHQNITMNRIRSTHGSKRGNRPERLKNANVGHRNSSMQPPLPASDFQSPIMNTPPPEPGTGGSAESSRPPRTSSVAPYPVDDGPPVPMPHFNDESRQPTQQSFIRPSSEYRPRDRPGPAAAGIRNPSQPKLRPYPASSAHTAPSNQFPPQDHPTTPMSQRYPSGGLQGGMPPLPPKEPVKNYPSQGAAQAYQRPPPSNAGQVHRPPADSRIAAAASYQYPSSGTPRLGTPVNTGSRPPSRPASAGASGRPPLQSATHSNAARPPGEPQSRPTPATTATRPPGKGAQSFEEMGVPLAKQENECTVM